ncbi:MAG: DUF1588 domain-containing protein [Pirellulales bacterium]
MSGNFKPVGIALLLFASATITQADDSTKFRHQFVQQYCTKCHSGEKPKGEFKINAASYELTNIDSREQWEQVLEYVADGEMPPEKFKQQPNSSEREQFLSYLRSDMVLADDKAKVGGTLIRRMNRIEHLNSLRDLFQIREIRLPGTYPEDSTHLQFDTMPDGVFFSTAHLQACLELATDVADRMVPLPNPEQVHALATHENMGGDSRSLWKRAKTNNKDKTSQKTPDNAYYFTGVNIAGWSGGMWDRTFKAHSSGVYRVRLKANAEAEQGIDGKPLRLGFYALNVGDYDLPKRANRSDLPQVGLLNISNLEPEFIEYEIPLEKGENFHIYCENRLKQFYPNRGANRVELGKFVNDGKKMPEPTIRIEQLEIIGPVAPLPRQLAFIKNQTLTADIAHVNSILFPLAQQAYRRPLTTEEKHDLISHVMLHIENAPSPEYGIHYGIRRILCSPQFLYREVNPGRLDNYGLASRMSYFLWSSLPDAELLEIASTNRLSEPDVLRQQVARMIADLKAQRFVKHFTGQWLDNRKAESIMVCDIRHTWSNLIRYGYLRSTEMFFDEILQQNHSIQTFIDSDFTYANLPMRVAWKFPGKLRSLTAQEADQRQSFIWPEPERLDLTSLEANVPAHVAGRGGILGLSGVLTATGDGVDSSPILRGVWILENFFGTPPPPPPSNVPALVADISQAKTVRETLASHQKQESCATCHRKIDPLGLAMENYDAVGNWRTTYYQEKPAGKKQPQPPKILVDTSGQLPDGTILNGPADIKQYLLDHPAMFTNCLTTKLLEYSTGRHLNVGDQRIVKEIVAAEPQNGYGFQDLLVEIIQSEAFQVK